MGMDLIVFLFGLVVFALVVGGVTMMVLEVEEADRTYRRQADE